ncbi:MAG TPA: FtsQ-type POTRA domain-containing protein [Coriobacteriia bacterium]|nr:FtsQ-type POTRA domain-containing protein [Coriobacteriia bacterium]
MASSSSRKSGSSGRSKARKRVVIGAEETVRVRYKHNQPEVESERRKQQKRDGGSPHKRASTSGAGRKLASSKRTERERRQTVIRLRRNALVVAAVAVVVLLCWGAVSLYNAPIFTIKTVTVSGNHHLGEADTLRLAAVPADSTLVKVPRSAIRRRLMASPWVRDARVDRDFPQTLRIRLFERKPSVIVDQGGAKLWIVSADGYWLGKRSAEETGLVQVTGLPKLPVKTGRKASSREVLNAVSIVERLSPELRAQVVSIAAPSIDKTALRTDKDVEIFIGEATEMAKKDRVAREILKRHPKAVYINVRVPDDPTWRGL